MANDMVVIDAIAAKILKIKGKSVMLDSDLAQLYEVKTKNLNKAVKKNIDRFPEDFMFKLGKEEAKSLRFRFGTSFYVYYNRGR